MMSVNGERVFDECDDGKFIDFEGWHFGYEDNPSLMPLVREIAEGIAEGMNNSVRPAISYGYTDNDITLEFGLGTAKGEWGPAWKFSMLEAVDRCGWSDEEKCEMASRLLIMAGILLDEVACASEDSIYQKAIEHLRSAAKELNVAEAR